MPQGTANNKYLAVPTSKLKNKNVHQASNLKQKRPQTVSQNSKRSLANNDKKRFQFKKSSQSRDPSIKILDQKSGKSHRANEPRYSGNSMNRSQGSVGNDMASINSLGHDSMFSP